MKTEFQKPKTVQPQKVKKEFPKPRPIIDQSMLGLNWRGQVKTFPLVRDDNGEITLPSGTRYSRKRQHYPPELE